MADSTIIEECASCGSKELVSLVFLGYQQLACTMQPIGEMAKEEPRYPLELMQCNGCGLAQLSCVVDPRLVFHPDYPYSSGNTKALWDDFADLAAQVDHHLTAGDMVVDIGGNDGTLLRCFPDNLLKVAVDPTDQVQAVTEHGITAWQDFFGASVAKQMLGTIGHAKVVTACNVLAHVEDVHDALAGIAVLLADDGVLVAENHDFASIIEGNQWDTVYHEHLRFYTPETFGGLLAAHGLRVDRIEPIGTHGGSFRTYASKAEPRHVRCAPLDTVTFANDVRRARQDIRDAVAHARTAGRVWAIGAAARAATVVQYCGLTADDIGCVVEVATSDKIGHYMAGTRIPVIDEALLFTEQPESVVLFSWHVAKHIVPKLRDQGYRGDIIIPLPTIKVMKEQS